MAKKKFDCVVAVGEYQDAQGETKTRWQNVGAVLQTDNGHMMLLDRTFNPAGMVNPDGRTNVIINLFEPQERQQPQHGNGHAQQSRSQPQRQAQRQPAPQPAGGGDAGFDDDLDSDIPF
jgi:hypothetical protein